MITILLAMLVLSALLFALFQWYWGDESYIPNVVKIAYLMRPQCWGQFRSDWDGDPFRSQIYHIDEYNQPRNCFKCGAPRWQFTKIDRRLVAFNFDPVNPIGMYAPSYETTDIRVSVAFDWDTHGFVETQIADIRPPGCPSVREDFGLPPAPQCHCLDEAWK